MSRVVTLAGCVALLLGPVACGGQPPLVIGRAGLGDGEFDQPRALAVSEHGLAVVDRSGRLQILELDGTFRTSITVQEAGAVRGFPCGVTWLPDGKLLLADTHRSAVTTYDRSGELVSHFGELGARPGQFIYPQRIYLEADGSMAVTEYGISLGNRVQVFHADGTYVRTFGGPDAADGGLTRPMGITRLDDGSYVVADQLTGLQIFSGDGEWRGRLAPRAVPDGSLPYGLTRDPEGTLYVACMATHLLSRISPDGKAAGTFGGPGTGPGRFREPWDVAWYAGYLYVVDRMNHRVQRFEVASMKWTIP